MLISQTDYDIAPGMTESQVIMNNAEGSNQVLGYMATISPGAQVTFKASYGSYYTKGSTPEEAVQLAESGLKWDLKNDDVPGQKLRSRHRRHRCHGH